MDVRTNSDECREHLWLDRLTPASGIELSGKRLTDLPGQPVIAGAWNAYGFPFNDQGQALIEVLLNDAQDGPKALLLSNGQTLQPIAVEGLPAPGLPPGETLSGLFYSKELADNGWITLMCRVSGDSIGANEIVR